MSPDKETKPTNLFKKEHCDYTFAKPIQTQRQAGVHSSAVKCQRNLPRKLFIGRLKPRARPIVEYTKNDWSVFTVATPPRGRRHTGAGTPETEGASSPRMELSSDPAAATVEMSQVPSKDDEPSDSDGHYESLPPHVSVATHMTAGAVAGILEHTVMYPVDSVKTRMQCLQPDPNAQYRSVYQALKRIIQTEGIFRPLRGLNITMMGAGPAHALYFACYERVKHSLSDVIQSGGNSHLANGLAGSVATVLHDAVMNPAEVVKQRMQMYNSPYRGLLDCLQTITRTEGLGAFYRSYSTQLTMNIPFQAVHFITYELMQEQLNPHRLYHPGSHIMSGAAAGAISAAITTPLDVCKTLLNTQENVALNSMNISGHLSGMANTFRTVYRLGGLAAFFKGAQARIIYQMPSTAIAWSVYEFFKYFLTKQQFDQDAGPRAM